MKIQVKANELLDTEIELVSLVKHGAIRAPFKIVKNEDLPSPKSESLTKKIANAFSKDPDISVAAVLVKTDLVEGTKQALLDSGFSLSNPTLEGGITLFKQEGYTDTLGSCIAVTDNVGVMLSEVVKEFTPFPSTGDFSENVAAASFFPSLHGAFDSLSETIWNVLNANGMSTEEAQNSVSKNVDAFAGHVKSLVAMLPSSVFKMEACLTKANKGSTLTLKDDSIANLDKGENMKIKQEAVSGDLGGLSLEEPVAKKEVKADVGSTVGTDESTVAKSDINTGVKKVKKGDTIVDMPYTFELDSDGNEIFLDFITKSDENTKVTETGGEGVVSTTSPEVLALTAQVSALATAVASIGESVAKSQSNTEDLATKKVVKTYTAADDLDHSLASRDTPTSTVKKSNTSESSWGGVLTCFDRQ